MRDMNANAPGPTPPSTQLHNGYRRTVRGREHLDGLLGPVLFAANHHLHNDSAVILSTILVHWRWKLIAAAVDGIFYDRELHWATPTPNEPEFTRPLLRRIRQATAELAFLRHLCRGVQPLPAEPAAQRRSMDRGPRSPQPRSP